MTKAALAIAAAIATLATLATTLLRGTRMECITYPDVATFNAETKAFVQPAYRPSRIVGSIALSFDDLPSGVDGVLRINSHHVLGPVWQGPIQDRVRIPFGPELTIDKGWDELRFTVIDAGGRRICGAMNEEGARIWLPDAQFIVAFLDQPIRDANGLLKMYNIVARKMGQSPFR